MVCLWRLSVKKYGNVGIITLSERNTKFMKALLLKKCMLITVRRTTMRFWFLNENNFRFKMRMHTTGLAAQARLRNNQRSFHEGKIWTCYIPVSKARQKCGFCRDYFCRLKSHKQERAAKREFQNLCEFFFIKESNTIEHSTEYFSFWLLTRKYFWRTK